MTTMNWSKVEGVFHAVAQLTPAERPTRLKTLCHGDEVVCAEVEQLLVQVDTTKGENAGELGPMPDARRLLDSLRDYVVLGRLGAGGQGVVYRAMDRSTKRDVVIKMLRAGAHATQADRRRFHREVELLARLRHPHIVSVLRSGETDDETPFYVMDYVPGESLDRYIRRKRLSLEDALRLFGAVCNAVQCAHQSGIIHRDLKPSNILVTPNGEPCIVDFGLARTLSESSDQRVSLTYQVLGTAPYMSPEQIRGRSDEIDTRTDVYALGVVLYELLTGKYPYRHAGSFAETLHEITNCDPIRPRRRWRADSGITHRSSRRFWQGRCPIDRELETIVLACLEKDRERRYQSAGELARDLERYLVGQPLATQPPSLLYVVRKRLVRHRMALIVVLALIAVSVAAGYFHMNALRLGRHHAAALSQEARFMGLMDPVAALDLLEQASAASPDWPKPQIERAFLLSRIGDEEGARTAAEAIMRRFPDRGEPHVLLAMLSDGRGPEPERHRRQAQVLLPHEASYYRALALPRTQSEEALALLDESLGQYPWNFDALVERARCYHDLGRYDQMLADADVLARVGPDLSLPWALKGVALLNLACGPDDTARAERLAEAIECFDRAIDMAPQSWLCYYNRALARSEAGDAKGALQDLADTLERRENFADAWAWQADVLFQRGERDAALDSYARWIELTDSPIAYHRRALAHLAFGQDEQAANDLRAAIARDDRFSLAYHDLGNVLLLQGHWGEAREAYDRGFELAPDDPMARLARGIGRWCTGNSSGAVRDFEQVIASDPAEFAAVHFWIWEIHMDGGASEDAQAALDAAEEHTEGRLRAICDHLRSDTAADEAVALCETDEERCETYYYLGAKARLAGRTDDARAWLRRCVETDVTHYLEYFLAHRQLGLLNSKTPGQG